LPYGPFDLDVSIAKLVITSSETTNSAATPNSTPKTKASSDIAESDEAPVFKEEGSTEENPALISYIGEELRLGGVDRVSNETIVLWHQDGDQPNDSEQTRVSLSMKLDPSNEPSDDQFGWQIVDRSDNAIFALWVNSEDGSVRFVQSDGTTTLADTKLQSGDDFQSFEILINHTDSSLIVKLDGKVVSGVVNLPVDSIFGSIGAVWDLGSDSISSRASLSFRNFKVEHSVAP
jgi:hypothetical protein